MIMLQFLAKHIDKMRTPVEWATVFEVRILDADGWRGKNAPSFDNPCSLAEFLKRVNNCTILPLVATGTFKIGEDTYNYESRVQPDGEREITVTKDVFQASEPMSLKDLVEFAKEQLTE